VNPPTVFLTVGARIGARSPSQIDSYSSCGMRYRLERVDKVSVVPQWSNVGGTAAHAAVARWERESVGLADYAKPTPDEAAKWFQQEFFGEIERMVETSGTLPGHWHAANGGREDSTWWMDHGPGWVADYVTAQEGRDYEVMIIKDALMIEVDHSFTAPGTTVVMRVILDQIIRWPRTGAIGIRDLKFGNPRFLKPTGIQLPAYRVGAADLLGDAYVDADWWGDFWVGRSGAPSKAVKLDLAGCAQRVAFEVDQMDRAERAGIYLPNTSSFCGSCGVRAYCPTQNDPTFARPWRLPLYEQDPASSQQLVVDRLRERE
jgi:hypothetical protein